MNTPPKTTVPPNSGKTTVPPNSDETNVPSNNDETTVLSNSDETVLSNNGSETYIPNVSNIRRIFTKSRNHLNSLNQAIAFSNNKPTEQKLIDMLINSAVYDCEKEAKAILKSKLTPAEKIDRTNTIMLNLLEYTFRKLKRRKHGIQFLETIIEISYMRDEYMRARELDSMVKGDKKIRSDTRKWIAFIKGESPQPIIKGGTRRRRPSRNQTRCLKKHK